MTNDFRRDLMALPLAEVQHTKDALEAEITELDNKIAAAKHKAFHEGVYADATWWRRVNERRRWTGRRHQVAEQVLAEKRKARRLAERDEQQHSGTLSPAELRQFFLVTLDALPPAQVAQMLAQARQRVREAA